MKYAEKKVEIFLTKIRQSDSKKDFRRAQTPNTTTLFSTKMASMGDDQEENIEMWKIKKVCYCLVPFSFICLFFLVCGVSFVFVCAGGTTRESHAEEKMRWLFLLSRGLLLSARSLPPRLLRRSNDSLFCFSLFLFTPSYLPLARIKSNS